MHVRIFTSSWTGTFSVRVLVLRQYWQYHYAQSLHKRADCNHFSVKFNANVYLNVVQIYNLKSVSRHGKAGIFILYLLVQISFLITVRINTPEKCFLLFFSQLDFSLLIT